jgi:hypothetical protein
MYLYRCKIFNITLKGLVVVTSYYSFFIAISTLYIGDGMGLKHTKFKISQVIEYTFLKKMIRRPWVYHQQ